MSGGEGKYPEYSHDHPVSNDAGNLSNNAVEKQAVKKDRACETCTEMMAE